MSGRWPLRELHGLRTREEEAARSALAAACAGERSVKAERDARANALGERRAAREASERGRLAGAMDAGALAAHGRHCAALRSEEVTAGMALAEAERRVDEARSDVARTRAGLAAARRALEVLERHRAAWADARRRRRERAEDTAQDDRAATAGGGG